MNAFFNTSPAPKIFESQNLPIMHCSNTEKVLKVVFAPSSSSFVEIIHLWKWPLNLDIFTKKNILTSCAWFPPSFSLFWKKNGRFLGNKITLWNYQKEESTKLCWSDSEFWNLVSAPNILSALILWPNSWHSMIYVEGSNLVHFQNTNVKLLILQFSILCRKSLKMQFLGEMQSAVL